MSSESAVQCVANVHAVLGEGPIWIAREAALYWLDIKGRKIFRRDEAGRLDHIGFTSTITEAQRPALTRKVEALQGEGFTGEAPGGPSRWSTGRSSQWIGLRPELVVEVRYDQVTGRRFRHGATLVRWRPDKSPRQCTYDQLRSEQVSALPDAMRAG
jgi:ATP-dependent DNA ligase